MESIVLVVHYLVCIFLIIVILLQAGKGADIGAAFGGGSQTVFGSRGAATFLSKLTTVVAIVFLFTSISLASMSKNASKSSILKTVGAESKPSALPETAPAATESAPSVKSSVTVTTPESKPTK